jgi:Trypsin-co-occurring domain 2
MTDNVTVAAAIKELRAQLEDAQQEGANKGLRFVAKSVELELGIVFRNETEGGGGVKAWFVDVSGKAKAGNETAHKVKLVLEPVGRDGKPTLVGDAMHEKE